MAGASLASPLGKLNVGLGLLDSLFQFGMGIDARREEQARYEDMKQKALDLQTNHTGMVKSLYEGGDGKTGLMTLYQRLADKSNNLAEADQDRFTSDYRNMTSGLVGQATRDHARNMSLLEGMGEQEKADTRQQFSNVASAAQRRLNAGGLGNTSLGASTLSGVARQERGALSRIDERLQGQRYNAQSQGLAGIRDLNQQLTTSGFDLSRELQSNVNTSKLAGMETMAQIQEKAAKDYMSTDQALTNNLISIMGGREGPLQIASPFGGLQEAIQPMIYAAMQPKPEKPKGLFGALAGGAGGVAGGSLLATALVPGLGAVIPAAIAGGAIGGIGGAYAGDQYLNF